MQRKSALASRDERGAVLVFVAVVMVLLLGFAAIAVDLGNGRQQKRNAQSAADSGALAGAYALKAPGASACSAAANCTAAYYTFQSAGIHIGSTPAWTTGSCGTNCTSYVQDGTTVQVTTPYAFQRNDPTEYVHVRTCWDDKNVFAPIMGFARTAVCAAATAENFNGVATPTGSPPPTPDCLGEDNFADQNDKPTIFPDAGHEIKAGDQIGATFMGFDSNLDLNSIVFKAPDATGQLVTLGYDPSGKNGYTLNPAPPASGPYTGTTGETVKITYKLPNAPPLPKTDANGSRIIYSASLHVADLDQDNVGPDCGNAKWSFTWDGQGAQPGGSACGENSFIASVYPPGGVAAPGDHIGAIYSDESPLQDVPWSTTFPFGIKFTLSGPGWTDANGNPTFVPYTVTPTSGHDKYSSQIDFQLPDASKFFAGVTYTASLTAYDTDQNKPGNDCGVATWTFTVAGGTAGSIRLVE
jgi:Flp pilus assembly protein TadG